MPRPPAPLPGPAPQPPPPSPPGRRLHTWRARRIQRGQRAGGRGGPSTPPRARVDAARRDLLSLTSSAPRSCHAAELPATPPRGPTVLPPVFSGDRPSPGGDFPLGRGDSPASARPPHGGDGGVANPLININALGLVVYSVPTVCVSPSPAPQEPAGLPPEDATGRETGGDGLGKPAAADAGASEVCCRICLGAAGDAGEAGTVQTVEQASSRGRGFGGKLFWLVGLAFVK